MVPRTLDEQVQWIDEHWAAIRPSWPSSPARTAPSASSGFGSLSPFRSRPAYATTVENSVYVLEDFHGRGIGRMVLDELIRLADCMGSIR